MELRRLRYFLALAHELHFERAAQRVNVSQAGLSRKISELEDRLGVRLFERTNQGTSGLTAAGKVLLPHAEGLLARLDQALSATRAAADGFTEQLRIGICEDVPAEFLAGAIAKLRSSEPRLDIQLIDKPCQGVVQELRAGRVDLGFSLGCIDDGKIEAHQIWDHAAAAVMLQTHEFAHKETLALRDLGRERLVLTHRHCACGRQRQFDAYAGSVLARPRVKEAANVGVLRTLVASGYGVGVVSAMHVEPARQVGLTVRPLKDSDLVYRTFILWRRGDAPAFAWRFAQASKAQSQRGA